MNREAGAYIEANGEILPDLNDEAMAGRKKLADEAIAADQPLEVKDKKKKTEPALEAAPAEVTNAEK